MTTRRIDEIVVGERHRRDLGDIASLAANVAELGLLHPIVIHGTLIAGERRPNRPADLSRRHLAIRSPNRVRKGSPR
jgi:hypothetical protein